MHDDLFRYIEPTLQEHCPQPQKERAMTEFPVHAFALDRQQIEYLIEDLRNCTDLDAQTVLILVDPNQPTDGRPTERSTQSYPSNDEFSSFAPPTTVSRGLAVTIGFANKPEAVMKNLGYELQEEEE